MKRGLLLRASIPAIDARAALVLETSGAGALVTDEVGEVGAVIELQVGWPPLVELATVRATVIGTDAGGAPGDRAQWRIQLQAGPATDLLLAAVGRAATPPVPGARARMLLVEDSAVLCDVFHASMRRHFGRGATAVTIDVAGDVAAAWVLAAANSYDLIVVDYLLPEPAGHQLIARLRATARSADTPVVAVSLGGSAARHATLAAGADLFLAKPLALGELFSTIDLCLAKGGR